MELYYLTNTKLLKVTTDDRLHTDGFSNLKITLGSCLLHLRLVFCLATGKALFTGQNPHFVTSEPKEQLLCTDHKQQ